MVYLDIYDDGDVIWLDREYYYDGRKEKAPLTNAQYGDSFDDFFRARPPLNMVIMDPSADSFETELKSRGYVVRGADNEVLVGLQNTATMFFKRKIRVHKVNCPHTLSERQGYVWDEKARQRGIEQPLKENDHCMDGVRYYIKTMIKKYRLALGR